MEGDTLCIRAHALRQEPVSFRLFGKSYAIPAGAVRFHTAELSVLVPDGLEKLRADVTSGDLSVENVSAEVLEFTTRSGDVDLENVSLKVLYGQTGSGDVEGDRVRCDVLTLHTGSGDVDGDFRFTTCSLEAGSGDLIVKALGQAQTIVVKTGSGDVELEARELTGAQILLHTGSGDWELTSDRFAVDRDGEGDFQTILGDGSCRIVIQTGSGDAELTL